MARKAKPVRLRKLKRNPLARALASGAFKARVEPKPGAYKRRPRHPKADETGD